MIKEKTQITETLYCIIYQPNLKEERICFLDYSNPKIIRIARNFNSKELEDFSFNVVIDDIIQEQISCGN
jgi:hypothetical protein